MVAPVSLLYKSLNGNIFIFFPSPNKISICLRLFRRSLLPSEKGLEEVIRYIQIKSPEYGAE